MKMRIGQKSNISKTLEKSLDNEYIPKSNEFIAKVILENSEEVFVSVPKKFRNFVFISVGMFIAAEYVDEGIKIKGILTAILYEKQIRYLEEQGLWPRNLDHPYKSAVRDRNVPFPSSDDSDISE